MIRAAAFNEMFRRGYIALTDASDERPLLLHVDDVLDLHFKIDGYEAAAVEVTYRSGGDTRDAIVFEPLKTILALIAPAGDELSGDGSEDLVEF